MSRREIFLTTLIAMAALNGCATTTQEVEPNIAETLLPATPERIRAAISQVLTDSGYDLDQADDNLITTAYRTEIRSPWDLLLRWRFGVGKSYVEATLTPQSDIHTHVRLQVFHRAKDGIFDAWDEASPPLAQSAEQQMRLIRQSLNLL